jgi:tetratricopeptide (TPR) repeat protein
VDEFAAVSSSNALKLALETLAVRSEFQHADHDEQAQRIRYLETTFGERWGGMGAVAEAFGHAWGKNGDLPNAITWYERARIAPDGSASMAALEQLVNFYVRTAWDRVETAQEDGASTFALRATADKRGSALGTRGGKDNGKKSQAKGASTAFKNEVKAALSDLEKARELLDRLVAVDESVERVSLYGSLWKREAMIHGAAGDIAAQRGALARMEESYRRARTLATKSSPSGDFYPRMNVLAAQLVAASNGSAPIDVEELAAIRKLLADRVAASPDFWNVVGQTELKMYEALAAGTLAQVREALWQEFSEHHQRVGAPRMWYSVCDNATLVLRCYARERGGAEAKAADSLLDALRGLTLSGEKG